MLAITVSRVVHDSSYDYLNYTIAKACDLNYRALTVDAYIIFSAVSFSYLFNAKLYSLSCFKFTYSVTKVAKPNLATKPSPPR